MVRVDRVSIPGRVIPKTQNMVLDATLLNTQYYDTDQRLMEQSTEWSSAPYWKGVAPPIEKGVFGSPSTKVGNLLIPILPKIISWKKNDF